MPKIDDPAFVREQYASEQNLAARKSIYAAAEGPNAHDVLIETLRQLRPRRVLDERERKILHLRFFKGLTQSQIAQQVGISQMHVSRLIRRSLEKIRDEIAAEEPDETPVRG